MTTPLPSLVISRSAAFTVLMSSIAERLSKARRMSATVAPCRSRAMASIAFFAERYSRYDGITFMPPSATIATTMRPMISAMRLKPCCCLLPISPPCLLAERSEAAELVQVQPDEEGLADDVLIRDEAPDPAVARIVAVVTHHEVVARRHGARKAVHIVVAITRRRAGGKHGGGRIVLEKYFMLDAIERLDVAARELHALARQVIVDLPHRHEPPVDGEPLVAVFEAVAGQADHALDVVERRILGIAEHHHIAAMRFADGDDLPVHHRKPDAVGVLVHQDEVAHQQRRHHRARRNLEWLDQKRAQQEDDEDDREEGDRVFDPPRLLQQPRALLFAHAHALVVRFACELRIEP